MELEFWSMKFKYIIWANLFLMIPMPLGMGPSGALTIWRQYEVQSRAFEQICLVMIPLPMGMGSLYIWSIKLNITISFELMFLRFVPVLLWENLRLLPFQKQYCTYWSFWIKLLGGGWARLTLTLVLLAKFSLYILVFVTCFSVAFPSGELPLAPCP